MDAFGRLWLFGGSGYPATGITLGNLNDLWQFDPLTGNWTWVKGGNAIGVFGTYGTIGVPNIANTPGTRSGAATWTDDQGHFWLFGGNGNGSGLISQRRAGSVEEKMLDILGCFEILEVSEAFTSYGEAAKRTS